MSNHTQIALGIGIGLLASGLQSLGLTIQRRSHVEDQKLPVHEQRLEYRRPMFLLGFAIFISSNLVGSILQIIVLPIIILAPLGAISLLWNALFAKLILGDLFSPWMIFGTLGIIAGALLIAIFGIVPEPTHSIEDLIQLFSRPAFITYFSLLGAVLALCLVAAHITEYALSRRIRLDEAASLPRGTLHEPSMATTGLVEHIAEDITVTESTPLLQRRSTATTTSTREPSRDSSRSSTSSERLPPSIERTRIVLAFSYASFSGILSGMCLLFAKSGVELLVLTIHGDNQFWRWQAWMLILGLVAFALLQLWYLHKALVLAGPTLVCPSAFCFYNLSSIVNGLVYYNQFSLLPPFHLGLVGLGIVVLLTGVWLVSVQAGDGGVDISSWSDEGSVASQVEESETSSVASALIGSVESGKVSTSGPPTADTALPDDAVAPVPSAQSAMQDTHNWGIRSPFFRPSGRPTIHIQPLVPGYGALTESADQQPSHTSPSSRRPRLSHHGRSTSFGQHHHQHHLPHLPGQLGETIASTLAAGGGLQIGLSPISPGFSILPSIRQHHHRARRTSTMTSFGGDEHHRAMSLSRSDTLPPSLLTAPSEPGRDSGLWSSSTTRGNLGFGRLPTGTRTPASEREARRRRTVSEGDVGRMANTLPTFASAAQDLSRLTAPSSPSLVSSSSQPHQEPDLEGGLRVGGDVDDGTGPWRWIRRNILRR